MSNSMRALIPFGGSNSNESTSLVQHSSTMSRAPFSIQSLVHADAYIQEWLALSAHSLDPFDKLKLFEEIAEAVSIKKEILAEYGPMLARCAHTVPFVPSVGRGEEVGAAHEETQNEEQANVQHTQTTASSLQIEDAAENVAYCNGESVEQSIPLPKNTKSTPDKGVPHNRSAHPHSSPPERHSGGPSENSTMKYQATSKRVRPQGMEEGGAPAQRTSDVLETPPPINGTNGHDVEKKSVDEKLMNGGHESRATEDGQPYKGGETEAATSQQGTMDQSIGNPHSNGHPSDSNDHASTPLHNGTRSLLSGGGGSREKENHRVVEMDEDVKLKGVEVLVLASGDDRRPRSNRNQAHHPIKASGTNTSTTTTTTASRRTPKDTHSVRFGVSKNGNTSTATSTSRPPFIPVAHKTKLTGRSQVSDLKTWNHRAMKSAESLRSLRDVGAFQYAMGTVDSNNPCHSSAALFMSQQAQEQTISDQTALTIKRTAALHEQLLRDIKDLELTVRQQVTEEIHFAPPIENENVLNEEQHSNAATKGNLEMTQKALSSSTVDESEKLCRGDDATLVEVPNNASVVTAAPDMANSSLVQQELVVDSA